MSPTCPSIQATLSLNSAFIRPFYQNFRNFMTSITGQQFDTKKLSRRSITCIFIVKIFNLAYFNCKMSQFVSFNNFKCAKLNETLQKVANEALQILSLGVEKRGTSVVVKPYTHVYLGCPRSGQLRTNLWFDHGMK